MPTTTLDTGDLTDGAIGVLELMLKCGLVPSKKEARRLVEQGGVELDGQKVTDVAAAVTAEQLSGEGIMLKREKGSSTVRCSVNEKRRREDNSPPAPFFRLRK